MECLGPSQFGDTVIDPENIVEFPAGLPAFEHLRRFLLDGQAAGSVGALHSIDQPWICFPVVPVENIDPDYEVDLSLEDRRLLRATEDDSVHLLTLAIVTLTESGPPTANLLAPVIIHRREKRGVQSVRTDTRYSHRHPLTGSNNETGAKTSCS